MADAITYDEAVGLAEAAFARAHPSSELPGWFEGGAFSEVRITKERKLVKRWFAQPANTLGDAYQYEAINGHNVLTTTNELGEKRVVISGPTTARMIDLFVVEVDLVSGVTKQILDTDFSAIKADKVERLRGA